VRIDHIGIVVNQLEANIEHWCSVFGYTQMTKPIVNTRQKVRVVFLCKAGSIDIKLIEPVDESSSVFALARRGGGLHHLCFKCNDLNAKLDEWQARGLRVLAHPQPGEAFESEDIAFVFAKHGLNIELISTDKRAGRLDDAEVDQ
jgi:methylmalonyl-CoA/ethylmalonyl-CoA epimerase